MNVCCAPPPFRPARLSAPPPAPNRPEEAGALRQAGAALVDPPDPLATNWGFGANENAFNAGILQAVSSVWPAGEPPLDARLFKALVAVESAFDPTAVSPAGAAGLVQLMPNTALRHGLKLRPVDERLIPSKALPVGVAVLAEKHDVITHPENYFRGTSWGDKVARAYQRYGPPTGDDLWRLDLAAYNGGGSTVLRAMARAFDQNLDPRNWSNLVEPANQPRQSPLYHAVSDVYGEAAAMRKYREMAAYPLRILALRDRT